MGALAVVEPSTSEEAEDLEDEEPPQGFSFFAEDERAAEAVCDRVWRIYIRESAERGFARGTESRAAPGPKTDDDADTEPPSNVIAAPPLKVVAPPAPRSPERRKEVPVPKSIKGRGELLGMVVAAFQEFQAREKRTPSSGEVFALLGPGKAKSVANVSMAMSRAVKKGLIERGARGRSPSAVPPQKVSKPQRVALGTKPRPDAAHRRATAHDDTDLAVVLGKLLERRERDVKRLADLDKAIAAIGALGSAS